MRAAIDSEAVGDKSGGSAPGAAPAGAAAPAGLEFAPATPATARLDSVAVLLAALTLLLAGFAVVNGRQQWRYRLPGDQAYWRAMTDGPQVVAVEARAATPLRVGDRLIAIDGQAVDTVEAVTRAVFAAGVGAHLSYTVRRGPRVLTLPVTVTAARPPLLRYAWLDLVGLFYLGIGLYVFLRRRGARQARHFYLFCLASFVLFCLHYTGKLNEFDWTVFWANEAALLLAPCLFLHFALAFPWRRGVLRRYPAAAALLYLPAALWLALEAGIASASIRIPAPVSVVQQDLDRVAYLLFGLYFLAGAACFAIAARPAPAAAAGSPLERVQARWIARGAFAGILPFLLLYLVPFLLGVDLPRWTGLAVLPLVLIPLACAYAILRHRLLEVDIILRRGVVYTLATAAVAAVYCLLIGLAAALIHTHLPGWGWSGWLLAIVITALLFEPLKGWFQVRIDRMFYRDRYDYRRTLIAFGREMSAQPELHSLLTLVLERLARTLSVERAALFLARDEGEGGGFALAQARGIAAAVPLAAEELGFLRPDATRPLFFENPQQPSSLSLPQRRAVRRLDLNYYLPCLRQERVIAWLGLGKTTAGEFLSGEDIGLVETLTGTLAVAVENARLYATLQGKVRENERLKDFNQNIVESIRIGVVAVDLEGVVESWNAQMEVLSALPRRLALGRRIGDLLGAGFAAEFARMGGHGRVSNAYKLRLHLAGRDQIVNLAVAPLVTRRFEVVGRIVLLDDVTSEVELERQLVQADRLSSVGLLAAGVAHEVNTPLAVISSYAQMLAKQVPAGDPRAQILETITRQTFRASEIVGSLLNFSRTGGTCMNVLDLNAVLRETLDLVSPALRGAGIEVCAGLAPGGVAVVGDAGKLQQVFLNLVLNARDAMPGGGRLELHSGAADGCAWVTVADTGEGIAPDLHHRIFDPFFTTKSPAAGASNGGHRQRVAGAASSGTGLGLAVTYGIVREHGGTITVASELRRGARFRVELPAASAAAVDDGAAAEAGAGVDAAALPAVPVRS